MCLNVYDNDDDDSPGEALVTACCRCHSDDRLKGAAIVQSAQGLEMARQLESFDRGSVAIGRRIQQLGWASGSLMTSTKIAVHAQIRLGICYVLP